MKKMTTYVIPIIALDGYIDECMMGGVSFDIAEGSVVKQWESRLVGREGK
jgi:hypothetical protein